MAIRLKNTSEYLGKEGKTDWWKWTASIESDEPKELEEIDYVEYRLHPIFSNPVVWVRERKAGFPLERKGWGSFPLRAKVVRAKVVYKDKTKLPTLLEHKLELECEELLNET